MLGLKYFDIKKLITISMTALTVFAIACSGKNNIIGLNPNDETEFAIDDGMLD